MSGLEVGNRQWGDFPVAYSAAVELMGFLLSPLSEFPQPEITQAKLEGQVNKLMAFCCFLIRWFMRSFLHLCAQKDNEGTQQKLWKAEEVCWFQGNQTRWIYMFARENWSPSGCD